MSGNRRHILLILAAVSLLAIAAYEAYWLRGLFLSRREAAVSRISSAISKAETSEFTRRIRRKLDTDSVIVHNRDAKNGIKILSLSMSRTVKTLPDAITVSNLNDLKLNGALAGEDVPDIEFLDSLLSGQLDTLSFLRPHQIRFIRNGTLAAVSTTEGYVQSPGDLTIRNASPVNHGTYEFQSESISGSVIRGMFGVILTSIGILFIIAFAFWFILRTMKKQQALDKMKLDFTGNITHELKTPIAVAYAANDAMLNYGFDRDRGKREKYLKITRDSLEKLGGMVERILSTTLENRDSLRLDLSETDLKTMLEEVAAQTRMSAGKPCEVSVTVRPENLAADMDRKLMSSVMSTLLDNAVKYSGNHVKIALSAYRMGEKTLIAVSDDGIGIAPDDQRHIFEKFYRVPTGDVHDVKGYGIGLFFAKTLVERHGGSISVKSEPGKGSTFTIEI